LNRSSQNKSSVCSNASTAATNIRAAASDWRSVNAWCSSTAAIFGWSSLRPAADRPSASPSPRTRDTGQQANPEVLPNPGPHTVLLVEDNPTDAFVIKEVLEGCGLNLRLRVAVNGQDALQYLQDVAGNENSPCPALVLLDLNLPRIGGIEVLRELRRGSRCNRTPVIIVTSSAAEADRIAAQRLSVEAYFQKPRDLTAYMELAQVIKSVLIMPKQPHEGPGTQP